MIILKDINKTYNNGTPLHVLKGIDMHIDKGEFVSIRLRQIHLIKYIGNARQLR